MQEVPAGRDAVALARCEPETFAAKYVDVALKGIEREFPVMPQFVVTGPGASPTHREMHPAFYGSFDWHSCVAMHWVVVRMLRLFPGGSAPDRVRKSFDERLTAAHIEVEAAFFRSPAQRSIERPYGWAWLLALQHELHAWGDPDGRRWAAALEPLAGRFVDGMVGWLGKLTYPQRAGMHGNSAFSMSRALGHALARAGGGDERLLRSIRGAADRWFGSDEDYPAHYEPSGADFLSPALTEAELMSRLLDAGAFGEWLRRFLPGLAQGLPHPLFEPAQVSDASDGQIAHLHGLNLSRAWAFAAIASRLPPGDPRRPPMLAAAERHAAASLPSVTGSDFAVEHWLAIYATLLICEPGRGA